MIKITYLSNGKLEKGVLDSLHKITSEVWVDCLNPSKTELKKLSRKTNIPYEDFSRAIDEDERPSISEFDSFSRITFHAPVHKGHNYISVPFTIFVKHNFIIIIRNNHIDAIERFEVLDHEKKVEILKKDKAFTIFMLVNEVINHFFQILDDIELKVERIEKNVFKEDEKIVKEIFKLKKTLIYFHKSLTGNRKVIEGIEKQFVKEIKGKNTRKFHYLMNDVNQLIDMVDTYRDMLTNSLDVHYTALSNDMNAVMKRLTIITSFVMVPALIAGIYGMNFVYPPDFELSRSNFYSVLMLMGATVVVIYVFFKKMKWV